MIHLAIWGGIALFVLIVGTALVDRLDLPLGLLSVGGFLLGALFTLATYPLSVGDES